MIRVNTVCQSDKIKTAELGCGAAGETSVFVLEPHLLWYPWRPHPGQRPNDFFLYSDHECLAVGGAGHWAIHLDNELLEGSSEPCATFDSPCLASAENFKICAVEVWHIPG